MDAKAVIGHGTDPGKSFQNLDYLDFNGTMDDVCPTRKIAPRGNFNARQSKGK
jgi:hypothetical protein